MVNGHLRKLAVGHEEWSALDQALENGDRDRLWHEHASASEPEDATPCIDALIALRRVPMDSEAKGRYRRLRGECLRDSARGHAGEVSHSE